MAFDLDFKDYFYIISVAQGFSLIKKETKERRAGLIARKKRVVEVAKYVSGPDESGRIVIRAGPYVFHFVPGDGFLETIKAYFGKREIKGIEIALIPHHFLAKATMIANQVFSGQ